MNDSVQGFRASALFEGEGPIRVVPWPDPVADASGFAARSEERRVGKECRL